jgi:hypothetical protein
MNGWSSYQNKCIKLFEDKIFSDAKNFCESLNATLISIHSTQENDFVLNLVQKQSHVWIGGKRDSNNNFEWINGNAFNYTNWSSGQPDSGDNVVMSGLNGEWGQRPADISFPFLCHYMKSSF